MQRRGVSGGVHGLVDAAFAHAACLLSLMMAKGVNCRVLLMLLSGFRICPAPSSDCRWPWTGIGQDKKIQSEVSYSQECLTEGTWLSGHFSVVLVFIIGRLIKGTSS